MHETELRRAWEAEQEIAKIRGWDFSHIDGRHVSDRDLPWDFAALIRERLTPRSKLIDCDTGGGEFLLSLGHPPALCAATEGYPPNAALCEKTLTPLGVDFHTCKATDPLPFGDASFDLAINRHGDLSPRELFRVLRPGGVFLTEQVGADNDRDLVRLVLPDAQPPFPGARPETQSAAFAAAGFRITRVEEAYRPIVFYDVGAFVWFARIIEWEFPGFSVDACFPQLLELQKIIERDGSLTGTIHRYLMIAEKPLE